MAATDDYPCIGIDFGTSKCVMTWFDARTNRAEVLRNAEGDDVTPSLVYIGDNETLVGRYAKDMLDNVETRNNVISSVKSELSRKKRYSVPGAPTPVTVAAQIFRKLKHDAETGHFHEPVQHAVITYPADFDEIECERIAQAAHEAGFLEVELLPEPVSAAISYARTGLHVGDTVLVYDLGAGTFDLALLERDDSERGGFRVALPPTGLRYGGDNLDRALYDHCDRIAIDTVGRPISPDGSMDLKFLMECRARKENLSNREKVSFSTYLHDEDGTAHLFRHEVVRADFERFIVDELEGTVRATRELLGKASDAKMQPATILLVGGASRVPLVTRLLQETLPLPPLEWEKRDVAVALGAAYHAHAIWNATTDTATKGMTNTRRVRKRVELSPDQAKLVADALSEANTAYRAGHYAAAIPLLERIREVDPQHEGMLQMLAASLSLTGDTAGGIRLFQQLTRAYHDNPYYHQNLGKALEMADRPDEAVTAYQASLRINPNTRAQLDLNALQERLARERGGGMIQTAPPAAPPVPIIQNGPVPKGNAISGIDGGVPTVLTEALTPENDPRRAGAILLRIMVPPVAALSNVMIPVRCFVNGYLVGSRHFAVGLDLAVSVQPGNHEIRVEGRQQTGGCTVSLSERGAFFLVEVPFHWEHNGFGQANIRKVTG